MEGVARERPRSKEVNTGEAVPEVVMIEEVVPLRPSNNWKRVRCIWHHVNSGVTDLRGASGRMGTISNGR